MKTANIILTSILILFAAQGLMAQSVTNEKEVQKIRKEYQRINKTKLTAKTINWINEDCPPYSEGKVTFYYENNKLVKIFSQGGEDHGEWKEEYYFKDGNLFFVYRNNKWGSVEKPDYYQMKLRLYVRDNEVIKKLQTSPVKDLEAMSEDEIKGIIKTANALKNATTKNQIVEILFCGEDNGN